LVALILTFGSISGADFNPAVSLADASQGGLGWSQAAA
jgi:glycerol uptake facilitator-like aquaporin